MAPPPLAVIGDFPDGHGQYLRRAGDQVLIIARLIADLDGARYLVANRVGLVHREMRLGMRQRRGSETAAGANDYVRRLAELDQ